jgi:hypothetical protein
MTDRWLWDEHDLVQTPHAPAETHFSTARLRTGITARCSLLLARATCRGRDLRPHVKDDGLVVKPRGPT